jgi:hypothetical protein
MLKKKFIWISGELLKMLIKNKTSKINSKQRWTLRKAMRLKEKKYKN